MMMKRIVLVFLLIISICVLVFVYNDDFLYSKQIMKIISVKNIDEDISSNSLGLKEKHYTKKLVGVITNGKNRGKMDEVIYEETYSSVVTDRYRVGDKVIISKGDISLKRDFYLVLMLVIFLNLIYIVGNYKGLLSIVSVVLNMIVIYIGLFLYFKGINLLFLTLLEIVIFSILSLFLAGGVNKKTIAAIIAVVISTIIMFIMLMVVVKVSGYKGINFNELSFLTVPVEDVLLCELLIGTVGAVMDVAITISASISELIEKNNKISIKKLNKSSKEIGKDIMSTMSNVLFFTYLCGGLPVFVLAYRNGFSMYNYISGNFTLELSRFLIGSIGIVMTIPISSYVSIRLMRRGEV